MASSDYFMRQIEGMTDMLAMLLFDKKSSDGTDIVYETQTSGEGHALLIDLRLMVTMGLINEAENLLFERIEADSGSCYLDISRHFYSWLDDLSDSDLNKSNFSRSEITEGRNAAEAFYKDKNRQTV